MKLRINGNSIRLRLLRSEVARFVETGRVEERVYFAPGDQALLIYSLEYESGLQSVEVRCRPSEVVVVLPREIAISWAETEQTGVYASVEIGSHGDLAVVVEKDFACLDLSDADNQDTFPNPQIGAAC
jgi:hypothetical protein